MVALGFSLLLLWRMYEGLQDYRQYVETTTILKIPIWYAYLPVLASLALLAASIAYLAIHDRNPGENPLVLVNFEARQALGAFVGAEEDSLVFVPNATTGLNIVARSLHLQPGDLRPHRGHDQKRDGHRHQVDEGHQVHGHVERVRPRWTEDRRTIVTDVPVIE